MTKYITSLEKLRQINIDTCKVCNRKSGSRLTRGATGHVLAHLEAAGLVLKK